jgi:hypothetical protein
LLESEAVVIRDAKVHLLDGMVHREDGPALIDESGSSYYLYDRKHDVGSDLEWLLIVKKYTNITIDPHLLLDYEDIYLTAIT